MYKYLQSSAAVFSVLFAPALYAADLRVEVRGISSAEGKLMIALFDQAQDFPRKWLKGLSVDATLPTASAVFTNLPPGKYAVSVYHDENGNGKLDTNLLQRPTEHFGFSRDAMGMMGPPNFADAQIELHSEDLGILINLR